jgi:hypothetical protein
MAYKIDQREIDARVANLFGEYEKAATLYAMAVKRYWKYNMYAAVLANVIHASENLELAGMREDVVKGLIMFSKLFVEARLPKEAITLSGYYKTLEWKDPFAFRGGSQFDSFIKALCKQKLLFY